MQYHSCAFFSPKFELKLFDRFLALCVLVLIVGYNLLAASSQYTEDGHRRTVG